MTIIVAGITSDIGAYIAQKYISEGHKVFGTYRKLTEDMRMILKGADLQQCDFSSTESINNLIEVIKNKKLRWDIFISAVGVMEPIDRFESVLFDKWESNIYVNTVSQLRLLNGILSCRRENACVYFMTSKGINDTFPNHSAYCLSKIMLVKMCELLDDEIDDCRFIAFNPGFIRTKIIDQEPEIYKSSGTGVHEDDYDEKEKDKVFRFIEWSSHIEKNIISGRNYFVKYDEWGEAGFTKFLTEKEDTYKLRRSRDTWGGKS